MINSLSDLLVMFAIVCIVLCMILILMMRFYLYQYLKEKKYVEDYLTYSYANVGQIKILYRIIFKKEDISNFYARDIRKCVKGIILLVTLNILILLLYRVLS